MAEIISGKTFKYTSKPYVLSYASVGGKMEKEGPYGDLFDITYGDSLFGEKSFEKAESKLQKTALMCAVKKATVNKNQIDCIFGGDLLNQCIGTSFGMRDMGLPFVGVYGACSTMALSLMLAGISVDCGMAKTAAAVTSSHFCSAERQYRYPLNYGNQRTQTAQRTVTAAGAVILSNSENQIYLHSATAGRICDLGVTDANNMGAAMAPAAADTIYRYFSDTFTTPNEYDAIFTGDLGHVGTLLLYELLEEKGIDIKGKHKDCGLLIYNRETQDVHSGGSGCGCAAGVLCSYILNKMSAGHYKNILFCATGALLSPTSSFQGESIPGVAHLVNIRA